MGQGPSPTHSLGSIHAVWSVTAVAGPSDLALRSEDRPGNIYITCIDIASVVALMDYML